MPHPDRVDQRLDRLRTRIAPRRRRAAARRSSSTRSARVKPALSMPRGRCARRARLRRWRAAPTAPRARPWCASRSSARPRSSARHCCRAAAHARCSGLTGRVAFCAAANCAASRLPRLDQDEIVGGPLPQLGGALRPGADRCRGPRRRSRPSRCAGRPAAIEPSAWCSSRRRVA